MFEDNGKRHPVQRDSLLKRGYTITERIGEGGYGVVLMVRSARHHGRMAIKVVEKSSSDGVKNRAELDWSINNEKQFAEMFDHPYINAYHEIIETTKRLYLVMDYYPDGTLLDYYRAMGSPSELVAFEWFAQLCSALEYVHKMGFAHRDVKMDNVLLDRQRRVRLADFGMCTAVKRSRYRPCRVCRPGGGVSSRPAANRSLCGSSLYMSPELLAHGPYYGQLADVWAAGVLLYCLVTGRFPFPFPLVDDDCTDDMQLVMQSQRVGYAFNSDDRQRLSNECRSFFGNIFVNEQDRKKIKELKKDKWMIKMSQKIQVPFFNK